MQANRHNAANPKADKSLVMSQAMPHSAGQSAILRLQQVLQLPGRVQLQFKLHAGWWILPAAILGAAFWIWIARLLMSAF
jgi:hypothetical protein